MVEIPNSKSDENTRLLGLKIVIWEHSPRALKIKISPVKILLLIQCHVKNYSQSVPEPYPVVSNPSLRKRSATMKLDEITKKFFFNKD